MTTLIAWGNIHTPFPFHDIPADLVPANLLTLSHGNPRMQQRWQCRRLAHFLLWQLLKTAEKPTALLGQILRTETDRPQFPPSELDFNISHSGDWVAVILHISQPGKKSAVGIDIESPCKERPYLALLEHFASAEEITWFQQQTESQSAFYRIWCLREAVLKSQGVGIAKLSEVTHQPETLHIFSAHCPRGQLCFTDELPFYLAYFVNQTAIKSPCFWAWNGDHLQPQRLVHKIHYNVNN
ncbi:4'-phosphopantetheinyl transferase superfamily protein [uncultured Aggregatibacter sp.]|uniref:4'-phosphopantetheinyl transferase family protein n=1 Tax=uncultured Aggregatibacter sp. TaxID=470564 RepID=UPI00280573AA|nr:4'-phosphopantetheinyl transferase superfamily protein [uncultured Aggregatibacter sp.]